MLSQWSLLYAELSGDYQLPRERLNGPVTVYRAAV